MVDVQMGAVLDKVMTKFIVCQHVTIIRKCVFWLPRSIGDWISPPFDKVVISASSFSVIDDFLDVINLLSFN
jgi:hypothetical protein